MPPIPPSHYNLDFVPNNPKAAWWAAKHASLGALSNRSYHLSIASTFLTSKMEELHLLREIRALNLDGIKIYNEIIRYLKENCEGIEDLRICWDMEVKMSCTIHYDEFVRKAVGKCEW
jgi:hypothetical protein